MVTPLPLEEGKKTDGVLALDLIRVMGGQGSITHANKKPGVTE